MLILMSIFADFEDTKELTQAAAGKPEHDCHSRLQITLLQQLYATEEDILHEFTRAGLLTSPADLQSPASTDIQQTGHSRHSLLSIIPQSELIREGLRLVINFGATPALVHWYQGEPSV